MSGVFTIQNLPLSLHTAFHAVSRTLSAALGSTLAFLGMAHRPPPPPSSAKKNVIVITGCSSGLGLDMALNLASPAGGGFVVYAGVRKELDAKMLLEQHEKIKAAYPSDQKFKGTLVPLIIDVATDESVAAAVAKVKQDLAADPELMFHGFVTNAGMDVCGAVEAMSSADIMATLNVNLLGTTRTVTGFTPLLREFGVKLPKYKTGGGRVIIMGSMFGRLAPPFEAPYDMSKFAMEALTDCLRIELGTNFSVTVIEPGQIQSKIWVKRASEEEIDTMVNPHPSGKLYRDLLVKYYDSFDGSIAVAIPASYVTDAVKHALTATWPLHRYVIGWDALEWIGAKHWLPDRLYEWYSRRLFGDWGLP